MPHCPEDISRIVVALALAARKMNQGTLVPQTGGFTSDYASIRAHEGADEVMTSLGLLPDYMARALQVNSNL